MSTLTFAIVIDIYEKDYKCLSWFSIVHVSSLTYSGARNLEIIQFPYLNPLIMI